MSGYATATHLHFYSPMFLDIFLLRKEYPRELRICIKIKYNRCGIYINNHTPQYERRLHIFNPMGFIELKRPEDSTWIKISIDEVLPCSLDSAKEEFSICSKSLSLEEIHEIMDRIKGEKIDIRWSFQSYGFIPPDDLNYTLKELAKTSNIGIGIRYTPATAVFVTVKADGIPSQVDYIRFIKNVIIPAEMIDRIFIEVPIEPVEKNVLDNIRDTELREALEILFKKQRILREVLEEYRKALTASDYKDVISKVRGVVEHLTQNKDLGKKVFGVLRKALDSLSIIEEIPSGSGVRAREIDEILNTLDSLSYSIFKLTSKLGSHQPDYIPKPHVHDAELVLYTALALINYMIKVLLRYAMRT